MSASAGTVELPVQPGDPLRSERVPIASIIEGMEPTEGRVRFCFQVAQGTLSALQTREYSRFDAQTTSNCCHGIALMVRELINASLLERLEELAVRTTRSIDQERLDPDTTLPRSIRDLCQLYILNYMKTICPQKGTRSAPSKLKSISPLGSSFFTTLVKLLQRKYSNSVAFQYQEYLGRATEQTKTCGIPTRLWGAYVSESHLRVSSHAIYFASCIFSMQVSLAHLILTRAKIAIVNDVHDSTGKNLLERYVKVLEGNGTDGFNQVDTDQGVSRISGDEPVVVFGGCAHSDEPESVKWQMDSWLPRLPNLILACDVFYPQFPNLSNDVKFNKNPIIPKEELLQEVIDQHRKTEGVSAANPTLFCLNHIYTSSFEQVSAGQSISCKIPGILLNTNLTLSK